MKILVTGGTGTVGSQVVKDLVAHKEEVYVLTRDPAKAKGLPNGVKAVVGNLADVATVRSAFTGMDAVFLLTALSMAECSEGLLAVCGLRLAKVKRAVFLSIHRTDEAPYLPHFGAKLPIEWALADSIPEYTILRPNNFYQNDNWYKDVILNYGIYPQPLGKVGVSRVDVRDIAEAATLALREKGHAGKTYNLVGPDELTGESCARTWSEALGREIKYGGEDMDAWEKQTATYMPAYAAFDFRLMYEFFQNKGLKATPDDITTQTKLLGHPPRSYEAYVKETAAGWK